MVKINQESPSADDEINLTDLWRVLARRKALVLAMPVLSLLVAALYLLITPAVFESRAVIQVGQVGQVGQVEAPTVLVQRLKEQYRVDDKDAPAEMPRVTDISQDKKGSNSIITILVQEHSAEGAQKYLDQVVKNLLAEHSKRYNQAMNVQYQRLQSLDKQVQALSDHIGKLSTYIEAVRPQNPAQAAIIAIEKGKLLTEVPNLEAEYTALQLALSEIQSQPSKLLREPTLPKNKTKPKRASVLALAAVLGLMLGLFAAFIAEFFVKARQQLRERTV